MSSGAPVIRATRSDWSPAHVMRFRARIGPRVVSTHELVAALSDRR